MHYSEYAGWVLMFSLALEPNKALLYDTEHRECRNMDQHDISLWDIVEELQRPTVNLKTHKYLFHVFKIFPLLET